MRVVELDSTDSKIVIKFDFDPDILNVVKELSDRKYNPKERSWSVPLSTFHSNQVISELESKGFSIDPRLYSVSDKSKPKKKFVLKRDGLYDFQSEAVDFIDTSGGRVLIADEQGLGKTVESLYWLSTKEDINRILVVAPASVIYKWQKEIERWDGKRTAVVVEKTADDIPDVNYVIMSYAIMTRKVTELQDMDWDCIIFDECFPAGTIVSTELGDMKIEDIVNDKLDVSVASCNSLSSVVELKKVTGWIKKPLDRQLLKIIHEHGELICTDNHPIYTEEDGYVEARKLLRGKTMRVLQSEIPSPKMESDQILWKKLFSKMENKSDPVQRGICTENKESQRIQSEWLDFRQAKESFIGTNEEKQSHVDDWSQRQDDCIQQGKNLPFSWRKWTTNQSTVTSSFKNWRSFRISNWCSLIYRGGIFISSKVLQGGHWISRILFGNRSRWKNSSTSQVEIFGRQEDKDTISSRVVSVEVYESGDRRELGNGSGESQFVYCLDVEDNHNFFADRVLVHNCHRLKSDKAQRTRAAQLLDSKYLLALSGTPILNRPAEFYTILSMVSPTQWGTWWNFVHRYCAARKTYFGLDVSGSSNLAELSSRLTPYMIRRLKKDVLQELPDLTRTKIPVRVNGTEINTAYRNLYNTLRETGSTSADALRKLNVLRQAIGRSKVPIVVEVATEILESNEDSKIVIYAVHKEVVKMLTDSLKIFGVTTITGEVSNEDRAVRQKAFQERPMVRVMILSSAGGEGIDLYRANTIIFAEREWGPAPEEQAEARCHRIGQKNAVEAIYLIAEGTIDEDIDSLIESKRSILGQLVLQADIKPTIESDLFNRIMRKGGR